MLIASGKRTSSCTFKIDDIKIDDESTRKCGTESKWTAVLAKRRRRTRKSGIWRKIAQQVITD